MAMCWFMCFSGVRPFGVSLLLAGWDEDGGKPFLYQCDPSVSRQSSVVLIDLYVQFQEELWPFSCLGSVHRVFNLHVLCIFYLYLFLLRVFSDNFKRNILG